MISSRVLFLRAVLFLAATKSVTPFVPTSAVAVRHVPQANRLLPSPLFAYVYEPTGGSHWDDSSYDYGIGPRSYLDERQPQPRMYALDTPSLKERLTHDERTSASLPKLAAAFAPPSDHINIGDIEHLDILTIDERHMDLVAVVCDRECCETHLVPVQFPNPCEYEQDAEGCIVHNIEDLSAQADAKLRQKFEWSQTQEADMLSQFQELTSFNQELDLPTWWVPTPPSMMFGEDIQRILNGDDFSRESWALGVHALSLQNGGEMDVQSATVLAVCPAGFYLRVKAKRTGMFDEGKVEVVDAPVAFANGYHAHDGPGLMDAMEGAIGSALRHVEKFN